MTGLVFVAGFIVFLIGACAYLPFGILAWLWVALQTPHQVMGVDFQFNLAIVVACLVGLIANRKKAAFWIDGTIIVMILLLLHSGLTTFLAYNPDFSYPFFDRLWKTMLLAGFVAVFMQNRTRMQAVTWVMAMSIAALAFKGAAFSIMTAGQFRVFGPPASQITDNNLFAGAVCIALPFLFYLIATTADRRVKLGLTVMAWLMPVTVIFTYSRGGLVTLLSVAFCYFLQSSRKIPIVIAAAATIAMAIPLMPSQWVSRMQTISETVQDTSKADDSVQGRFNAWYVYTQIALDRPFIGGGFRAPEVRSVWDIHMPQSTRAEGAKAAHNSIFQVLGEHGFLGLAIYLSILALAFKNIAAVIVRTRHIPELQWAHRLAVACGISFVAYNVAGLTLSLPYYDFALILIVQVACLRRLVAKVISERERPAAERRFAPIAGTPSLAIGAAMRSHGTSRDSA